jgi:hypothetical protein
MGFVRRPSLRGEASASCEEAGFTSEPSQAVALRQLQQVSALLREQLENVRRVEQDGTFSTAEADAERARIEGCQAAAKAAHFASLREKMFPWTSKNLEVDKTILNSI